MSKLCGRKLPTNNGNNATVPVLYTGVCSVIGLRTYHFSKFFEYFRVLDQCHTGWGDKTIIPIRVSSCSDFSSFAARRTRSGRMIEASNNWKLFLGVTFKCHKLRKFVSKNYIISWNVKCRFYFRWTMKGTIYFPKTWSWPPSWSWPLYHLRDSVHLNSIFLLRQSGNNICILISVFAVLTNQCNVVNCTFSFQYLKVSFCLKWCKGLYKQRVIKWVR